MRYRTEALAAIHETMTALHEIGAIDDKTMRGFDKACLRPCRPIERRKSQRDLKALSSTKKFVPST